MSFLVKFPQGSSLLWFAFQESNKESDVKEQNLEPGETLEVERVERMPYLPENQHDFTGEWRLEKEGYYARYFETPGSEIVFWELDSPEEPVIVET